MRRGGAGVVQGWRRGGAGVTQGWRTPRAGVGAGGGEGEGGGAGVTRANHQPPANHHQPTAIKTTRDSSTRADTQTGKGAMVLDHQPARPLCLVSCVLPKRKRRSRLVVSTFQVGRSVDRRRALARNARVARSTGRARSVRNARADARSVALGV